MIKNINVSGIHGKKLEMILKEESVENNISNTCSTVSSCKKVFTKPNELKRTPSEKWNLPEHCFTYAYQFCEISKLYLNMEDDNVEHRSIIIKELTSKVSGYKRQDIEKKIFQKDLFISLESVIEKLLCSKMKCYYCKQSCELLYKNMYSKKQWTLDRIDNDIGHNADNVVISCLECNLKKGTMDSHRFKYGKQIGLKFRKLDCVRRELL